ncbi:hypothetical protein JAAARDRAFT_39812 [Jaapia argillacea MUCL 33604]|uniref:DUF6534 domain-containing protein n=1 Tax=Jaapia argillacea MUCL 33604 TaxID=933084 RepID=A0A067PR93_9AGAM|nr:hypothetical protein JAAARDRAFT_39812 [Jaapia argillacea MUCL 33604]
MSVIDLTVGPNLFGTILNVFLHGVMWMQCVLYFTTFKSDKAGIRALVWFQIIAGTMNTGLIVDGLYTYTITNFGDLAADQQQNWTVVAVPAMTALIGAVVQIFFARRVYILTSMQRLVAVIGVGIVLQFPAGISIGVLCGLDPNFTDWGRWQIRFPTIAVLVLAAVVDFSITASLTWSLYRSKTGFSGTDDIVTKLIRLTIQTGLLVAIFSVIDLILFLSSPWPFHELPGFMLNKLSGIALLLTLNSRHEIRQNFGDQRQQPTKDFRQSIATGGVSTIQIQVATEASTHVQSVPQHPNTMRAAKLEEMELGTRGQYGIHLGKC